MNLVDDIRHLDICWIVATSSHCSLQLTVVKKTLETLVCSSGEKLVNLIVFKLKLIQTVRMYQLFMDIYLEAYSWVTISLGDQQLKRNQCFNF